MLDKATKRAMLRGMWLRKNDPLRWFLERMEWSDVVECGGAWDHRCPICKRPRPDGKGGPIKTGHKKDCIAARALKKYPGKSVELCGICDTVLNVPGVPDSVDCGGDCAKCMREAESL